MTREIDDIRQMLEIMNILVRGNMGLEKEYNELKVILFNLFKQSILDMKPK